MNKLWTFEVWSIASPKMCLEHLQRHLERPLNRFIQVAIEERYFWWGSKEPLPRAGPSSQGGMALLNRYRVELWRGRKTLLEIWESGSTWGRYDGSNWGLFPCQEREELLPRGGDVALQVGHVPYSFQGWIEPSFFLLALGRNPRLQRDPQTAGSGMKHKDSAGDALRLYQNRHPAWSIVAFQDCYSAGSPLQAYFFPSHGNGEAWVLGKLPYTILPCCYTKYTA
jgi:hypothetical protein